MVYDEVLEHNNKIARVELKNHKRKVGWVFVDFYHELSEEPLKKIYCIHVNCRSRFHQATKKTEAENLEKYFDIIPIEDIVRIHSVK